MTRRAATPAELPEHLREAAASARMGPEHERLNVLMDDAWPIPTTPERTLLRLIRNCALPAGRRKIGARPRWSVVSDLTAHGSTYSALLCVWAGLDPNEMVVRRK